MPFCGKLKNHESSFGSVVNFRYLLFYFYKSILLAINLISLSIYNLKHVKRTWIFASQLATMEMVLEGILYRYIHKRFVLRYIRFGVIFLRIRGVIFSPKKNNVFFGKIVFEVAYIISNAFLAF
jgi:hypothetical protein